MLQCSLLEMWSANVQLQKISLLPSQKGLGNPGEGRSLSKDHKTIRKVYVFILIGICKGEEGRLWVLPRPNPFHGGDIFWIYTIEKYTPLSGGEG